MRIRYGMKIVIIAAISLVFAGGGYYYWEIYRLPDAALNVAFIFQENFGEAMQRAQAMQPKDSDDYAAVLAGVEAAKNGFENAEKRLSALWLPSALWEVRHAMVEMVRAWQEAFAEAEMRARFMSDLSGLVRTLVPKEMDKQLGHDATVGDLARLWTGALPQVKSRGDALLGGNPIELKEATFEELKSVWNEARNNFDAVLVLFRAQNQAMLMRDFRPDTMRTAERERAAFEKVGTFFDLVDKTISQNSAYDITRDEDASGKSAAERLSVESEKLNAAFKKFSDKYPDVVKKIEAEMQKRGSQPRP